MQQVAFALYSRIWYGTVLLPSSSKQAIQQKMLTSTYRMFTGISYVSLECVTMLTTLLSPALLALCKQVVCLIPLTSNGRRRSSRLLVAAPHPPHPFGKCAPGRATYNGMLVRAWCYTCSVQHIIVIIK
jgi:hypothetical protein